MDVCGHFWTNARRDSGPHVCFAALVTEHLRGGGGTA